MSTPVAENTQDRIGADALTLSQITKSYGHVRALTDVSVTVRFGQVTALVGDNGAGKSTLLKIAAGAVQPDDGTVRVRDHIVEMLSPEDAARHGIEAVHQDLALVPTITVSDNLFLGRELLKGRGLLRRLHILDRSAMRRESEDALARLGVELPRGAVTHKVSVLSGGQRQAVAICRAVHRGSRILLLDEPTAALGLIETQRTLEMIRTLRAHGLAILLISHNFEDVADIADSVVILRQGRVVTVLEGKEVERGRMVEALKREA